jgi:hypothetical protein
MKRELTYSCSSWLHQKEDEVRDPQAPNQEAQQRDSTKVSVHLPEKFDLD